MAMDPAVDEQGRIVAVVPAAGSGTRLRSDLPKPYVGIAGVAMLQRTLDVLLDVARIDAVVVAIAPGDERFAALPAASDTRVSAVQGANTRAGSVAAALARVREAHGDNAWALVHDAARPLVAPSDIDRLIDAVLTAATTLPDAAADPFSTRQSIVGGLLAVPVSDTLKRERAAAKWSELFEADDAPLEVAETVPRDGLWQAQTPQLFRALPLLRALRQAADARAGITDEASAMERAGHRVTLVEAMLPNPKITRAADVVLAEALLSALAPGTS